MKCPKCSDKLHVTHVYQAGETGETRDLRCGACGFKASSVTFLVERPQAHKKGQGGMALKRRIESGKLRLDE